MRKDTGGMESLNREEWAEVVPASKWYQGQEVSVATRADEHCPLFPLHTKIPGSTDAEQLCSCSACMIGRASRNTGDAPVECQFDIPSNWCSLNSTLLFI